MQPSTPTTTLAAQTLAEHPELRMAGDEVELETAKRAARGVQVDGQTFYVLEGDLLYDQDEIEFHLLQNVTTRMARATGAVPLTALNSEDALVVVTSRQKIVRWAPGTVLTYAVLKRSFPSGAEYSAVCENLEAAAGAWSETCGVEWRHVDEHDNTADVASAPDEIDTGLKFTVRYIDAQGKFIASAFFPTYPPARRRMLIDPSYFDPTLRFDKVGVLRHELGHVLGFRHEHIRSEAPALCPDELGADTLDLTAYDPRSVMHYFCGGVGTADLAITELDRAGAQKVYGLPFSSLSMVI